MKNLAMIIDRKGEVHDDMNADASELNLSSR
jgi:hypothetical protein